MQIKELKNIESINLLEKISENLENKEIASKLGLHVNTVKRWFDTGNVPIQYISDFKRILGKKGDADDQFFTKKSIAKNCFANLLSVLTDLNIDQKQYHFIEPSAGCGSFYRFLPSKRKTGIDLCPLPPFEGQILKEDYLLWNPDNSKKYIVVGNPPFGLRGHLALQFMNHSANFADVIAFILPQLFESDGKGVPSKRVDKRFKLAYSEKLQPDSFEYPNGESIPVNTIFQVWTKVNHDKIKLKPRKTCKNFIKIYSLSDGGTPSSTRNKHMIDNCDIYLPSTCFQGMKSYRSFSDLPNKRGYGILILKNKKKIKKIIQDHNWNLSAFSSTNASLNLRSSIIEDVVTNQGYYDER